MKSKPTDLDALRTVKPRVLVKLNEGDEAKQAASDFVCHWLASKAQLAKYLQPRERRS